MATDDAAGAQNSNRSAESGSELNPTDLTKLTNFKVRYTLETRGFSAAQAQRLLFVKWLHSHGTIGG
jgi:hypothetical protein